MPAEKDQRIDGLKGMRVLCRVGVSFTEEQKERIKSLVEIRKLNEAQAQAVVLVALNKQFGLPARKRNT